MAGRGVFIVVIGFTLIFVVMGYFWDGLSTRAIDNHTNYYKSTVAHNIAISGANEALRYVMETPTWTAGINNLSYQNGVINVGVTTPDTMTKVITSTGSFMSVNKVVKVKLMKATYAKYAWFTASVSTGAANKRTWITGDTMWGAYQTNQFLNINGDPVFYGKVSTSAGLKMTTGSNPQFLGGLVTGVEVPWPTNIKFNTQKTAAAVGASMGGSCLFNSVNLWLKFNSNGTVTYKTAAASSSDDTTKYSAGITIPLSTMAPNGIIYLDKGDIYVEGTLNGQVTIVADQSSGNGGGNVYFVNDLVYSTPPMVPDGYGGFVANNSCDDLMGVLATNNVDISSSVRSGAWTNNIVNKDIVINAGILCASGGMNLIGLGSPVNMPTGQIYLTGSMTAGKEEMVATYSNDVLTAGYTRHVVLDERFLVTPPLWFPFTGNYEIVSWLE